MEKLDNFWRDWIWCYKSYWIYERSCRFQSQRYIHNWSFYWIRTCCLYCIDLSRWLLGTIESISIPVFCCQRSVWLILCSIDNWKIQQQVKNKTNPKSMPSNPWCWGHNNSSKSFNWVKQINKMFHKVKVSIKNEA